MKKIDLDTIKNLFKKKDKEDNKKSSESSLNKLFKKKNSKSSSNDDKKFDLKALISGKKEKKSKKKKVYVPNSEDYLIKNLLEFYELDFEDVVKESDKIGKPILEFLIAKNLVTSKEIVTFFEEETKLNVLNEPPKAEVIAEYTSYKVYDGNQILLYYPNATLLNFLKKEYPDYTINLISYDAYQIKEVDTDTSLKSVMLNMVKKAIELEVSDIHMETKEYGLVVKMRVMGEMSIIETIDLNKALRLQKYIKDLASIYTKASNFDTEEWEEGQDARIVIDDLKIALRLAFTPSLMDGYQNYVIRLLKQESSIKQSSAGSTMVGMGYFMEDVKEFTRWLQKHQGLILVSGATGSGKSRMLNTLIASVDDSRKIVTAEDPVEYKIPTAAQHQVFKKEKQDKVVDMGFLQYIRSFMRQDPDIIFIGEWRKEKELTNAIVYASNTGHLCLTSLHANSVSIIPNLLINDYGLAKEDVANNSVGYVNQKLIKRICKNCAETRKADKKEIELLTDKLEYEEDKKLIEKSLKENEIYFMGSGCTQCTILSDNDVIISIGYTGRQAVYEWLTVDSEVAEVFLETTAKSKVEKIIRKKVNEGRAKRYIDSGLQKLLNKEIDFDTFAGMLN